MWNFSRVGKISHFSTTVVWKYWNSSSCGEISHFNTQQMWKNQKFCQIWRNFKILHMIDVKKSEIYPVFGCEISFVVIYAIFRVICFVAIYALLRGKNWAQNCIGEEKMTNMRFVWKLSHWRQGKPICFWQHLISPFSSLITNLLSSLSLH